MKSFEAPRRLQKRNNNNDNNNNHNYDRVFQTGRTRLQQKVENKPRFNEEDRHNAIELRLRMIKMALSFSMYITQDRLHFFV
jgi:hypothetical protein